jgi:hypothetical protein
MQLIVIVQRVDCFDLHNVWCHSQGLYRSLFPLLVLKSHRHSNRSKKRRAFGRARKFRPDANIHYC